MESRSQSQSSGISQDMGPKRSHSDKERKQQKRGRSSHETNGVVKKSPNGVADVPLNGRFTDGTIQNGLNRHKPHNRAVAPLNSLQSLVPPNYSHSVAATVREYTTALHLISMQNAQNGFTSQYPGPPHRLVHAGAVPPPNLPMPVGSVPGASFQAMPLQDASPANAMAMPGNINSSFASPLPLNQSSFLQLSQYVRNGAALPHVMKSLDGSPMQGLGEFITANSNKLMALGPTSPGFPAGSQSQHTQRNDSRQNLLGAQRSHGPSMDRYKNRWSQDEISNLRQGVQRFGKGGSAATVEAAKDASTDDRRSTSEPPNRKGESEQVWEQILKTYEFQSCRTARDLKDKWRQLKKKEQDDMLGVWEEARRLRLLSAGPNGSGSSSGSTSNGNSNSGDGNSSSSSNGHQETSNDPAADTLDSPDPSSSSPPGGSSSGSTSSPAPLTTPAGAGSHTTSAAKHASGNESPSPSPASACAPAPRAPSASSQRPRCSRRGVARQAVSENGASNEGGSEGGNEGGSEGGNEGGSEGSGSGGADGGSEGSGSGGADGGSEGGSDAGLESFVGMSSSNVPEPDNSLPRSRVKEGDGALGPTEADREAAWGPRSEEPVGMAHTQGAPAKRKREDLEEWQGDCLALSLDLGVSTIRASLVRTDGTLVPGGVGQRSVNLHQSNFTFSAKDYLEAVLASIDDAVSFLRCGKQAASPSNSGGSQKCSKDGDSSEQGAVLAVKVVGISCFAMSLLGVDKDGEALTPVYTYADTRNAAFASELRRKLATEGSLDFVEGRTAPVHGSYAPALLHRLQQSNSDECERVSSWQTLSSYVLSKLSGRSQPVTLSEASWTGLLDRVDMQWHQGLLNLLGVSRASLPGLCDADELYQDGLIQQLAKRWPELAGCLWARGVGDGAAANVGSRCEVARHVCVTMGASASMRMCAPNRHQLRRKTNGMNQSAGPEQGGSRSGSFARGDVDAGGGVPRGLWCYTVNRETMLIGGSLADGGSIFGWAMKQLAGGAEEMEALVAEASKMEPDSHGLTVLPFFSGERSTGFHGDAKATVTGMTLSTSRGELLRAMLESVALRLKGIFTLLCQVIDDSEECEVYASGEALFKSPLWQQILADALEVPIRLSGGAQQASSIGAAVMALRASGVNVGVKPEKEHRVYPCPAGVAAMQMAFERQEALYNRLYRA